MIEVGKIEVLDIVRFFVCYVRIGDIVGILGFFGYNLSFFGLRNLKFLRWFFFSGIVFF